MSVVANEESPIDIETVKRNAIEQGIALCEIALIYDGLTPIEKSLMQEEDLIKYENGSSLRAGFTVDGIALFPEKITGVYYLAA